MVTRLAPIAWLDKYKDDVHMFEEPFAEILAFMKHNNFDIIKLRKHDREAWNRIGTFGILYHMFKGWLECQIRFIDIQIDKYENAEGKAYCLRKKEIILDLLESLKRVDYKAADQELRDDMFDLDF